MADQDGARPRHGCASEPARKRRRGLGDDETADQIQIKRLPFEGDLLSLQPHDRVSYKNNSPNRQNDLELKGRDRSAINWIAPDRQIKSNLGLQLAAKIALDDDSFEAFRKSIQRQARMEGGVSASIRVQINGADMDAHSSEKEVSADDMVKQESHHPGNFEFGSDPSSVAVDGDPSREKVVTTSTLPRKPRSAKGVDVLSQVPERSISCPHCTVYKRDDANTHELQDCGFASILGDVPGCPLCNTLDHCFDECKERKNYPHERFSEDWKFLVLLRGGIPPVRSKTAWPSVALTYRAQARHGFPLTKAFALKYKHAHRHGMKYNDPMTSALSTVRQNLDSLNASEVFTETTS